MRDQKSLRSAMERRPSTQFSDRCDETNVGSIKVIEKNGGVLENVVDEPEQDVPKRRYWIELW